MNNLSLLEKKIYTTKPIEHILNIWRFQDKKIVFTNGCFDLIHLGHVDYLSKAADLGNKLVVGLNTDFSISKQKGSHRPIIDEQSRARLLAALFFVDLVVLFDEETPLELIKKIKPDVLVKGADYTIDQIVGSDFVIKSGGEVKTVEYLPGYSTTLIEEKIRNFS